MTVNPDGVVLNEAASRFELDIEGQLGVLAFRRSGDKIYYTHTEVPPRFRGRGYGAVLAEAALDYAEAERLQVVPMCSFVAQYIDENPRYQHLLGGQAARRAD